jgi:WD40 repeat protein
MVEKKRVGAHLDIVTNMAEIQVNGEQVIASASEDCLIKLWTLSSLLKDEQPEPKHILRNHMGPLFSLAAGPSPTNKSESLLFSGGFETDIKSWKVDGKGAKMTGSWRNGTEEDHTIW